MLVKLDSGGSVAQYPYWPAQLSEDNPETSFPSELRPEGYPDFNVYPVAEVDPGAPADGKHFELAPEPVQQGDGTWAQAWVEVDN